MISFDPQHISEVKLSQTFYHHYVDEESEIYKYIKTYRVKECVGVCVSVRASTHACAQKGGNIKSLKII